MTELMSDSALQGDSYLITTSPMGQALLQTLDHFLLHHQHFNHELANIIIQAFKSSLQALGLHLVFSGELVTFNLDLNQGIFIFKNVTVERVIDFDLANAMAYDPTFRRSKRKTVLYKSKRPNREALAIAISKNLDGLKLICHKRQPCNGTLHD